MTPKERLKRLESYSVCDNYREKNEDFREIEKALEVLEILKKYLFVNRLTLATTQSIGIGFLNSKNQIDDFKIIKEWLEDDN